MDGIYAVRFKAGNMEAGSGVAVVDGVSVRGGDASYYYKGTLGKDGSAVSGTLRIHHHTGPLNSIFGPVKEFGLALTGTVQDGTLRLQGHVEGMPQQRIAVEGRKVSDL